ncbi:hypothetical protein [Aerococcus urinaeequi]|uniref:hypothetical protein n=1 Tax=Aerococcus urinaeequi TaxID=51665 RepID=UPI003D6ABF55
MNKHDVNRKGTKDDHSFRNVYKIEISGLHGNNYDELDDNNLKISIKSILLKVVVSLIVGVILSLFLKKICGLQIPRQLPWLASILL